VKGFLRGVESGAMEPSLNKTSRNLGAGLATNWLRFSRQCELGGDAPSDAFLSCAHTKGVIVCLVCRRQLSQLHCLWLDTDSPQTSNGVRHLLSLRPSAFDWKSGSRHAHRHMNL
jgi:hypothetical protein